MICVECTNPEITCLYSEYKSKYVQLTVCQQCGNFADRYIEFDNVILFLDLLLLRPQAYRHVAFNVVEESLFKEQAQVGVFSRYRKLIRFIVLSVLFEVYLKWAYEEKSTDHTILKAQVLTWLPVWQYLFFVCQQVVEKSIFFSVVLLSFTKLTGWEKITYINVRPEFKSQYYLCVLTSTLLLSLSVKCLPILMLIWPYDNATVASVVVDALGLFNTIEALHMNTDCSYRKTSLIIITATVCSIIGKEFATSFAVSFFLPKYDWLHLFHDENNIFLAKISSVITCLFPIIEGRLNGR